MGDHPGRETDPHSPGRYDPTEHRRLSERLQCPERIHHAAAGGYDDDLDDHRVGFQCEIQNVLRCEDDVAEKYSVLFVRAVPDHYDRRYGARSGYLLSGNIHFIQCYRL